MSADDHRPDPADPSGTHDLPDLPDLPDLSVPRRVRVANAGGAGMSAIATVLAQMGHSVSGHDPVETPFLEPLRALGVEVAVGGHPPPLDPGTDLLATSTATPSEDRQVADAGALGIPVARRGALLRSIGRSRSTVAVAGTHGKTTTAGMLATALDDAGAAPSFVVGAVITGLGVNARWSGGDRFVVEADESDGTFLALDSEVAVVTNVEPDHLEFWGGFDELIDGFESFLGAAGGSRIVCADDPVAAELGRRVGALSYGLDEAADYRVSDVELAPLGLACRVHLPGGGDVAVELAVPGLHNARNATAALAAGVELGLAPEAMARGLSAYRGVARRFEPRGEAGGVTFVDSYDHLPAEIVAALDAARQGGWSRIVCAFQPHRYSRTEALWRAFARCFDAADVLVVTDVYGAGEAVRPGVTGKLVVDGVLAERPSKRVAWMPGLDDVTAFLLSELRPGDLCLTLGAGDLTEVPDRVVEGLRR